MTIGELLKSMYDSSKERVKTPIAGAYFFAFLIWNWRPALLLLFEDTSITNKIIVINDKYCNPLAIIGPIILAFIFTLGIPYLMVLINKILKSAKKSRIEGIYSEKIDNTTEKIKLAVKELELQDILSRSKEKEEFLSKIEQLESQISLNEESHTIVVNNLNDQVSQLKNLQNVVSSKFNLPSLEHMSPSERELWTLVSSSDLNLDEISELRKLPNITVTPLRNIEFSDNIMEWLLANDLIIKDNNSYFLTADGLRIKKILNFK